MGKIKLCMPYFNEDLVASICIHEAQKWVDEIHITEFDRSFKYTSHPYEFKHQNEEKVFYHPMHSVGKYLKPRKYIPHVRIHPITHWMKHTFRNTAWYNEAVSRNWSLWNADYADDDILVLTDIDEIIDSRYSQEIIDAVEKYNAVTIRIHFSNFYFNLFNPDWPGPEGYSYRIVAIKGKYMREKFYGDSDYLRKMGEAGKLNDSVKLLDGFKGFHHSWLGNLDFVKKKLQSYAHSLEEHSSSILNENGEIDLDSLRRHIESGKTIFGGGTMLSKDDTVELLPEVEQLRSKYPEFFF